MCGSCSVYADEAQRKRIFCFYLIRVQISDAHSRSNVQRYNNTLAHHHLIITYYFIVPDKKIAWQNQETREDPHDATIIMVFGISVLSPELCGVKVELAYHQAQANEYTVKKWERRNGFCPTCSNHCYDVVGRGFLKGKEIRPKNLKDEDGVQIVLNGICMLCQRKKEEQQRKEKEEERQRKEEEEQRRLAEEKRREEQQRRQEQQRLHEQRKQEARNSNYNDGMSITTKSSMKKKMAKLWSRSKNRRSRESSRRCDDSIPSQIDIDEDESMASATIANETIHTEQTSSSSTAASSGKQQSFQSTMAVLPMPGLIEDDEAPSHRSGIWADDLDDATVMTYTDVDFATILKSQRDFPTNFQVQEKAITDLIFCARIQSDFATNVYPNGLFSLVNAIKTFPDNRFIQSASCALLLKIINVAGSQAVSQYNANLDILETIKLAVDRARTKKDAPTATNGCLVLTAMGFKDYTFYVHVMKDGLQDDHRVVQACLSGIYQPKYNNCLDGRDLPCFTTHGLAPICEVLHAYPFCFAIQMKAIQILVAHAECLDYTTNEYYNTSDWNKNKTSSPPGYRFYQRYGWSSCAYGTSKQEYDSSRNKYYLIAYQDHVTKNASDLATELGKCVEDLVSTMHTHQGIEAIFDAGCHALEHLHRIYNHGFLGQFEFKPLVTKHKDSYTSATHVQTVAQIVSRPLVSFGIGVYEAKTRRQIQQDEEVKKQEEE